MKNSEIRSMEAAALSEKVAEMQKELVKLNAQVHTGTSVKNPGQIKQLKKAIARILTISHEKTTAGASTKQSAAKESKQLIKKEQKAPKEATTKQ